jgi:hypothetical protein
MEEERLTLLRSALEAQLKEIDRIFTRVLPAFWMPPLAKLQGGSNFPLSKTFQPGGFAP